MGFFAKSFLSVQHWSDEDLADEEFNIVALKVKNIREIPWGNLPKMEAHQASTAALAAKLVQITNELARRGLTSAQVNYKKLMRQIKK